MDPWLAPDPPAEVQAAPGHHVYGQLGSQAKVPSPIDSESVVEYDWQLQLLPAVLPVV